MAFRFYCKTAWVVVFSLSIISGSVRAESAPDRVRLQLKWRHQFQFAGYYAAIAKGYYREAGLEVSLIEAQPGQDPVDAVVNGEAEFGVGSSDLLLLRSQGKPLVVLATIFQHSPLVLLAIQKDDISDIQSLAGKRIMMEPLAAELFAYFKYEGVPQSALTIVPHTFNVSDLLSGNVAAISSYLTDEPFYVRAAGLEPMVFTPRAGGIDFYGDMLFTTEDQIRRYPDRVRAFREASLKGWEYAVEHPDEIVDLILQEYSQRKSREALQFEAQRTLELMHPRVIEVGHMNPGRWRHMADTYAEFGMLSRDFSLDGFLYDPNPRPDFAWLIWALGFASALVLALLGWILPLVRLNRRLQKEIVERKRMEDMLRASEKQYRELTEHAPFPVAISDVESRTVVYANHLAEQFLGANGRQLQGCPVISFYENPLDRARLLELLETNGAAVSMEVPMKRLNGSTVWALMSAGRMEFGQRNSIVVAFQDITKLRELQQELTRSKEAAESANAAKTRYLAMISHEVRTPMTGIIGMIGLIELEPLTREQRENLGLIASSAESLMTMIDGILDFAKIEAGRMELHLEAVSVAELVGELCRLFGALAQAKQVALTSKIHSNVPASVLTDAMRVRQILSNLISNAIKFTPKGSVEIEVTAEADAAVAKQWRIDFQVRDSGIGIAPAQFERLFTPYTQADPSIAKRFGGTGLGLSICRSLAELLGGSLSVKSAEGRGSAFTLTIMAAEAEECQVQ